MVSDFKSFLNSMINHYEFCRIRIFYHLKYLRWQKKSNPERYSSETLCRVKCPPLACRSKVKTFSLLINRNNLTSQLLIHPWLFFFWQTILIHPLTVSSFENLWLLINIHNLIKIKERESICRPFIRLSSVVIRNV